MLLPNKINLNKISHNSILNLIKNLNKEIELEKVFIDTVGPRSTLHDYLNKHFPSIKFIVEEKADSKFKIVSAASILAKTTRDLKIKEYQISINENKSNFEFVSEEYLRAEDKEKLSKNKNKKEEILEVGSGYPSDPITKKYLNKSLDRWFGFDKFVRFSWATAKTLIEAKCEKVDIGNGEEDWEKKMDILDAFGIELEN